MKYKVGDKVKIKSWEQMAEEYGVHRDEGGMQYIDTPSYRFIEDMTLYCGNTLEIQHIFDNGYMMIGLGYTWTDEMIEYLTEELPGDATYNDLDSDMLVTYKSGLKYFVTIINGEKYFINEDGIILRVPEDETKLKDSGIQKVEKVTKIKNGGSIFYPTNSYAVWKESKIMTVEEAEKALREILQAPVYITIS